MKVFEIRVRALCALLLMVSCGPAGGDDKNTAPVLRLRTPVIAPAGVPVTFDTRASEDDQGIVIWKASFGDGQGEQAQPGPLFTHVFEQASSYELRVQIFDAQGASASVIRDLTVVRNYWPPYCDEISPCEEGGVCDEGVCYVEGEIGSD